jgi:signal transduction histidine kinase
MKRTTALVALSLVVQCYLSVSAAELGDRDDALALIHRVESKFASDGAAATFQAINNASPEFLDRDLYIFAYNFQGRVIAHGDNPSLVGQNRSSLQDAEGNYLVRTFISVVRSQGGGWVDYCWSNPISVEDKSAYVTQLGNDYVVGVAVFR